MTTINEDKTQKWLDRHEGSPTTEGPIKQRSADEELSNTDHSLHPTHFFFSAPCRGKSIIKNDGTRYNTGGAKPLGYRRDEGVFDDTVEVFYRGDSAIFEHSITEDWTAPRHAGKVIGVLVGLLFAGVLGGLIAAATASYFPLVWGVLGAAVGFGGGFKASDDIHHALNCERDHRFSETERSVPTVLDRCEALSTHGNAMAERFIDKQKMTKQIKSNEQGVPVVYKTALTDQGGYVLRKSPINVNFQSMTEEQFRRYIGKKDLAEVYEFYFDNIEEA